MPHRIDPNISTMATNIAKTRDMDVEMADFTEAEDSKVAVTGEAEAVATEAIL